MVVSASYYHFNIAMSEWGSHFVECLRPFSRSLLAIAGLVLVKVGLAHDFPWPRIDLPCWSLSI